MQTKKEIKIQIRKRHFQLLELMVAAFILLICIAPTMRIFTTMYQSQQSIVRDNQRDHTAHLMHGKITELLYKHQIHFSDSPEGNIIPFSDPDLDVLLQKYSFSCQSKITIVDSYTPRNQENPTMYLGRIEIKMRDNELALNQKKKNKVKTIKDEKPADTIYEYFVYIDSGELKNGKTKNSGEENDDEKGKKQSKENSVNAKEKEGRKIEDLKEGKSK